MKEGFDLKKFLVENNLTRLSRVDKTLEVFNEADNTTTQINELGAFGRVEIRIDGEGFIKNKVVNDIKRLLLKVQGERRLFVDGKEEPPYSSGIGMG